MQAMSMKRDWFATFIPAQILQTLGKVHNEIIVKC